MSDRTDPDAATRVERPASGTGSRDDATDVDGGAPVDPPRGLKVDEVLGVGGMGVVFRAWQPDLARPIAYKRLLDEANDEMRARFLREARLTAQLDHPNIVPVHLLDDSGYAMKLVEGKTFSALIREAAARPRPLDDEHALETRLEHFLKVCDALAFAHDRGVIHRDIKPANVMIGAFGAVYLMDWGIARPIGEAEPVGDGTGETGNVALTRVGVRVGTVPYMAPEQARGETADARSDQYALGLLLQELISLKPAITRASEHDSAVAAEAGRTEPLDHIDGRPGRVPRELVAIVARATTFAPEGRYPSVRALADEVRRYLRGEAVSALPEGPLGRLLRFMSRHRRATLVAFAGVVAAAAIVITWTRYQHATRELAARNRGAQLTELYGDAARQARRIDGQLFQMEEALEGLTAAAAWALVGPEPELAPVYFDTDFADPARRPSDFTEHTAYRWPVSVDEPVVGVAPGADRTALLPAIRRLTSLRQLMRDLVVRAAAGDTAQVTAADARALMLARKSPIDYTYVDLPSGVHVIWPGNATLPPTYDVRTASFYQMSDHQHGKRWGAPYVDSTTDQAGDDLVLPCTQGVWSPTGEFLGVAGVEITVTKMVETGMRLPDRTTLRTTLVDGRGRTVIDSRDANKRFVASGKDEAVEFSDFDLPDIAAAIRAGAEGERETTRGGRSIVVAFVRLEAIGWYYVVEVDAATLGAQR